MAGIRPGLELGLVAGAAMLWALIVTPNGNCTAQPGFIIQRRAPQRPKNGQQDGTGYHKKRHHKGQPITVLSHLGQGETLYRHLILRQVVGVTVRLISC